jgi:hypothetical protein
MTGGKGSGVAFRKESRIIKAITGSRRSSLPLYMTAVTKSGRRSVTTLPLPLDHKTYAY